MEHKYVVAYYGKKYTKVFTHHGWRDQYIGEGIIHESPPIVAFGGDETEIIEHYKPSAKFDYARIEERYYPETYPKLGKSCFQEFLEEIEKEEM